MVTEERTSYSCIKYATLDVVLLTSTRTSFRQQSELALTQEPQSECH